MARSVLPWSGRERGVCWWTWQAGQEDEGGRSGVAPTWLITPYPWRASRHKRRGAQNAAGPVGGARGTQSEEGRRKKRGEAGDKRLAAAERGGGVARGAGFDGPRACPRRLWELERGCSLALTASGLCTKKGVARRAGEALGPSQIVGGRVPPTGPRRWLPAAARARAAPSSSGSGRRRMRGAQHPHGRRRDEVNRRSMFPVP
jgi:hypothetical protein